MICSFKTQDLLKRSVSPYVMNLSTHLSLNPSPENFELGPQGSVLGPILFLIYINDIDESVACKVLKFADDTKIYRTVNSQEDIESLRNDLKNLVKWSLDWQMLFNTDKCKIIHIGHSNCHADYYEWQ